MSALRTFSYGGGVQSNAALVLAAQGRIDFRVFLFANVGDDSEYPGTLRYVNQVAMPYAASHGIQLLELHKIRRATGQPETLHQFIERTEHALPIPVRMPDTGAPGRRTCTAKFKIEVIARWQRQHGATPEHPAVTGLGISVDEVHRARTDSGIPFQRLAYPLLDLRLRRSDCIAVIRRAGLPVPPKSACFFCPFHRPADWQRMRRQEPELFARAAQVEALLLERRARLGRDPVYLTRFGRPLAEAIPEAAGEQPALFDGPDFDNCESGYCMT